MTSRLQQWGRAGQTARTSQVAKGLLLAPAVLAENACIGVSPTDRNVECPVDQQDADQSPSVDGF